MPRFDEDVNPIYDRIQELRKEREQLVTQPYDRITADFRYYFNSKDHRFIARAISNEGKAKWQGIKDHYINYIGYTDDIIDSWLRRCKGENLIVEQVDDESQV